MRNDDEEYFNKTQLVVRIWSQKHGDYRYEVLFEEEAEQFLVVLGHKNSSLDGLIKEAEKLPEPSELALYDIPF